MIRQRTSTDGTQNKRRGYGNGLCAAGAVNQFRMNTIGTSMVLRTVKTAPKASFESLRRIT